MLFDDDGQIVHILTEFFSRYLIFFTLNIKCVGDAAKENHESTNAQLIESVPWIWFLSSPFDFTSLSCLNWSCCDFPIFLSHTLNKFNWMDVSLVFAPKKALCTHFYKMKTLWDLPCASFMLQLLQGPAPCPLWRQTVNIYPMCCCDRADCRLNPWLSEETTVSPKRHLVSCSISAQLSACARGEKTDKSVTLSPMVKFSQCSAAGDWPQSKLPFIWQQHSQVAHVNVSHRWNSGLETWTLDHWHLAQEKFVRVLNYRACPFCISKPFFTSRGSL